MLKAVCVGQVGMVKHNYTGSPEHILLDISAGMITQS